MESELVEIIEPLEEYSKIYISMNYSLFKLLDENRAIKKSRVAKIEESIKTNGWLMCPILVNERYEIIDGQGRFMALRNLKMPIYFIIQNGIGVNECLALNINHKNWTTEDYCKSYASRGIVSYKYLIELCAISGVGYTMMACLMSNKIINGGASTSKTIQKGQFEISEQKYLRVKEDIEFISMASKKIDNSMGYEKRTYLTCLYWCYVRPEIDKGRLFDIVQKKFDILMPVNTPDAILKEIKKAYNKNLLKENRIAFDAIYSAENI